MNGKKIISMLLAVVMVLQMIPGLTLPVSAADVVDSGACGETNYILTDDKVLTISGNGAIGDKSFQGCSDFTEVIIEEGVTTIGASAFQDCESLVTSSSRAA